MDIHSPRQTNLRSVRALSSIHMTKDSQLTPTTMRWIFTFFVLFVRFMLVPPSTYGTFLNLFVLINFLLIPAPSDERQQRFAATRIIFLLALFMSVENFQYDGSGDTQSHHPL